MLKRLKEQCGNLSVFLLWKAWQAKRNYPKFELEQEFLRSEVMGCRDSAEILERNCRMIWRRFGWWEHQTSTAVVRMHNDMYAVLGDRGKAAMVTIGALSYSVRWGQHQAPKSFLPAVCDVVLPLAAKGMAYQIKNDDKRALVQLFPSIVRDLRMRDDGLPTVERVLIWIARGPEFWSW